jgi:signal transduction histidine kinase
MLSLCKNHLPGFRPFLTVAAAAILGVTAIHGHAAESTALSITNLMQLRRLADSDQILVGLMNLEGKVCWSSETEGRVILQDDSGMVQLELDLPCQMPQQGTRISLEGNCTMVKTKDAIKLSGIPVVDNDGLHLMTQKSGGIYLKAGLHPIQVCWFNQTNKFGLEVAYAGPNVPRQMIPDRVLFRAQINSENKATNYINGLNYRCCEGLWWSWLPNLDHLPTVKTGEAGNFDIGLRSRDEHVGLQFSGYIQIAREGLYTFYTTSEDGSRLFIGEPSLRVNVIGQAAVSAPSQVVSGSNVPEADNYEWSTIEGTITSVNRLFDALEIELVTGSGHVVMKVAENSDCSFTLTPQNRILAVGVSRNILRLDGTKAPGEFFVQSFRDIDQRYVSPDLWAAYPLMTISNAMTAEFPSNSSPIVHFNGKIIQTGADGLTFFEDASGRIAFKFTGSTYPGSQQTCEVLGRLSAEGTNRVLRCGFFRRVGENSTNSGTLPILTTAEQVNRLNLEELTRGYPVKLRGVITSIRPADGVILQDTTRGIFVKFVSVEKPIPIQVGDYCEVEGTAMPGAFSPFIRASRFESIGPGEMPDPVRPTWDQLLNGSLQNKYVELEGVVTTIDDHTITLLTPDGHIKVGLELMGPALPKDCLNALVRMRGCIFVTWNLQTHSLDVGKISLDQQWVDVVQLAPTDPFALPTKRVGDLLKFDPQAGALQRVKVFGQIIYAGDAGCFLMDGNNGLRFIPARTFNAHVRDLVEVVGYPDLSGPSLALQEAVVRRLGLSELSKPRKLKADDLVHDEYDSTLVQVDGVLLGLSSNPSGTVLEIQNGLRRFIATVNDMRGLEGPLIPGSKLELTGVYVGEGGNRVLGRPIDSFRLLLNSGFDIRVISRPPWWTLRRLLMLLGVLAGVLMTALIWIKLLHRKVEERTQQLGAQIQQRQRVERQREIEQERARVANDLHDDLGAGLTEVNMLTSLVNSPATSADEKVRYLEQLNEMARCMVTSLDEIVWAVNPRNDTIGSLASYFCAYAQRLLDLASITCGLDVTEDLPDHSLDPKFRQELFLAFKEALTNVIRHAGAKKVWLRISVQDDALVIEVTDNGCGFEPCKQQTGADGLVNMQERLRTLGGTYEIQSEPGKGTTVRFQAPLPGKLP